MVRYALMGGNAMSPKRIACLSALVAFAVAASIPAEAEDADPAIVHLAFRDYLVTIHAGADAPLYTVRTADGALVASQLSAQQLAARYPRLHEQLEPAIAAPDTGTFLWMGPTPTHNFLE
jgi:hypothetical protein